MAEYVYPAVFHANEDGSFTITYPDLPGCITEGKNMANAVHMAQSALSQWIEYLADNKMEIPSATTMASIKTAPDEFANLICAVVREQRAVRRTVSIPKWMDDMASDAGLSLSRILQDALTERLHAGR